MTSATKHNGAVTSNTCEQETVIVPVDINGVQKLAFRRFFTRWVAKAAVVGNQRKVL